MSEFVLDLLRQYDLLNCRELLEKKQYSKINLTKQLDHLIKPFVVSEEQKKLKGGRNKFFFFSFLSFFILIVIFIVIFIVRII